MPPDPPYWLLLAWARLYFALVWLDRKLWRPLVTSSGALIIIGATCAVIGIGVLWWLAGRWGRR